MLKSAAALIEAKLNDSVPHHPQIATFPDHKHTPNGLLENAAPDFADVFEEAELYVLGIG